MNTNDLLLHLSTVLSATVITLSLFSRVPQIYAILDSGSSEGVSLKSAVLEMLAFSLIMTYQFAMEYSLWAYFETITLSIQDFVLTLVILQNRSELSFELLPYYLIYFFGCTIISLRLLPDLLMETAIHTSAVFLNLSKWFQLKKILDLKSTGGVVTTGWISATYTNAVRILTTLVFTQDIPILICLSSSEILNIAILSALFYYRTSPRSTNERSS